MHLANHVIGSAVVTLFLAGGCADVPVESDDSMPATALIAEALLPSGGTVRFYEPEPGVLIQFEQGPTDGRGAHNPDEDDMNEAEKYTLLTGDPAPARLVAAAAAVAGIAPEQSASLSKGLTGAEISQFGPREDFLRLYCEKTDRFYWKLGYSGESKHVDDGINYYRWGVNAIQGQVGFKLNVQLFRGEHPIEGTLPEGWYAGATVKVGGAGGYVSSFSLPRSDGALLDHCVNFHY